MATRTSFFEACLGVFQGGGCRGAAFAGAVAEAASWGVNFVGLAGASAGSIVAALLAAGATPPELMEIVEALDFKTFLIPAERLPQKPPLTAQILSPLANRVWRGAGDLMLHRGSHSSRQIDTWLNAKLKELLPKITEPRVQFQHLPKPVWIVAANLISRRVEVWSQDKTPTAEVAHAVRCSCTIPILFQPVDGRFVDGALLSNLPTFVFSDRQRNVFARRILAFTLHSDASNEASKTAESFLLSLVNTSVDGASDLQSQLVPEVHEIRINTGAIESTDFDKMTPAVVTNLVQSGRDAAHNFFKNELSLLRSPSRAANICEGDDESYAVLTEAMLSRNVKEVWICLESPKFVYSIFPTLMRWRQSGAAIKAYLPPVSTTGHSGYQMRLLKALGIELGELSNPPFKGFLIDPSHQDNALAVVYWEDPPNNRIFSTKYESRNDRPAIVALLNALPDSSRGIQWQIESIPTLRRGDEEQVIRKLKQHVFCYARSEIRMEDVPISSIDSLCRLVRGYKFHQVRMLCELFKVNDLSPI